jgi:hypothetical protein
MFKMKNDLERIAQIAERIRPDLEAITGLPLDLTCMKYKVDDRDILNDTDIMAFMRIHKESTSNEDWRDKIADYNPLKPVSNFFEKIVLKCMGEAMVMKYNENEGIAVNPRCLTMSDTGIAYMLAHELVHPMDDQHFRCITDTVAETDRYNFVMDKAAIEHKLRDAKHNAGLIGGYLCKNDYVKGIEAELKIKKNETDRFMTVMESHAEYVRGAWVNRKNLSPKDFIGKELFIMGLWGIPLLLNKGTKAKLKQYAVGKKFISEVYRNKADMGFIYENTPTQEELNSPSLYFENRAVPQRK